MHFFYFFFVLFDLSKPLCTYVVLEGKNRILENIYISILFVELAMCVHLLLLLTYGVLLLPQLQALVTCLLASLSLSTSFAQHLTPWPGHNQQAPASCRSCMRMCCVCVSPYACSRVCECVCVCTVEPIAFVNFPLVFPCKTQSF